MPADFVLDHIGPDMGGSERLVVALAGPQASGKTTAAQACAAAWPDKVWTISLDDFYLTKSERQRLADRIHPLFVTRGPPGTHDTARLQDVIGQLLDPTRDGPVHTPVFDKLADDRLPQDVWRELNGAPRAVLVEGWCLGALPDPASSGAPPLNTVEQQDAAGIWRDHQERQLAGPYAKLWDQFSRFISLRPPSFETVFTWRLEQEAHLLGLEVQALSDERRRHIVHFVQHYERITRRMMAGAQRPSVVVQLDERRRVVSQSEVRPNSKR